MWLLDHPNPNGTNYYTSRTQPIRLIVVHTAEVLPDFTPPDRGAEAVARYASTTNRRVSWHQTVDSDTIIPMLPDDYTAFHVIGWNTASLGVEIATRASDWTAAPDWWVDATITNLAHIIREWGEAYDIPYRQLTKEQVVAGEKGIVGHATLDPTRRTDPGPDFPWGLLFDKLGADMISDDDIQKIATKVWDQTLGPSAGGITVATALQRSYLYSKHAADLLDQIVDRLSQLSTDH